MLTRRLKPATVPKKDMEYINQWIAQSEPVMPRDIEIIPVCEPDLRGKEEEYVNKCIKEGWISSMGKYVRHFEELFATYCGMRHAVSVTNGTHALELAMATLDIGPGDEVIVPTFTMIATANAVTYMGATPVFVDARPDTWNIDETKIEAAITSKTKAIVVVHIYGHMADMDVINQIAHKHHLFVIEDAAEAHGATFKGHKAGSMSDISCFSFYANKIITTGEGGMILTNNEDLYRYAYKLHNHAFADTIHFWHEFVGYNFRMTNLQAAIGMAQMERIDEMIGFRRKNAQTYMELLADLPGVTFPVELAECKNTYWMFGILLDKSAKMTRDELRTFLAAEGIETRTFFIPLHLQPIYYQPEYQGQFPVSENLSKYGLYLPSSSKLTRKEITFVAEKVRKALG